MKRLKTAFFRLFTVVDRYVKFPALKKGEVGIQVGFDMYSPLTSDLFEMSRKVGAKGLVLGIDPDEWNHQEAKKIMDGRPNNNIRLQKLATFSEKSTATFKFGRRSSWSQLGNIAIDETVDFSGREEEVGLDTLDHILEVEDINILDVAHVNITNNGAEYHTLIGFEKGLKNAQDLALTIISGRYDASGTIDGRPDYELVTSYLQSLGYETKFYRVHQLFWWGFCVKLLINRKWVFNSLNYGVVFAAKGKTRIPFYQSFS
jgi:FkbM family methyltransferase